MNSRWYDPAIGRFISADTIIPDPTNPQAYNRYSYVYNNPIKYVDPDGHAGIYFTDGNGFGAAYTQEQMKNLSRYGYGVAYDQLQERNDAYGFGISGSISVATPLAGVHVSGGLEHVYNLETGENTLFLVFPGYGFDVGIANPELIKTTIISPPDAPLHKNPKNFFSATFTGYVAEIYNVEDNVENYSGSFEDLMTTVAVGPGVTMGEAYTPGDDNREEAYAQVIGLTGGYGFTVSSSSTYYTPLFTKKPDEGISLFPRLVQRWNERRE